MNLNVFFFIDIYYLHPVGLEFAHQKELGGRSIIKSAILISWYDYQSIYDDMNEQKSCLDRAVHPARFELALPKEIELKSIALTKLRHGCIIISKHNTLIDISIGCHMHHRSDPRTKFSRVFRVFRFESFLPTSYLALVTWYFLLTCLFSFLYHMYTLLSLPSYVSLFVWQILCWPILC